MDPNNFSQPQGAIVSGPDVPAPSASAGDFAFTDSPAKKSHAGLIIGIVILFLAIAGLVAYLVISNSRTSLAPEQAFTSYKNHLLYGQDSESSDDFDIAIYSAFNSKDSTYFSDLKKSYDDFLSSLSESQVSQSLVQSYSDKLNLIVTYATTPALTQIDLLETYAKDGEAAASSKLNAYVAHYKNFTNFYNLNFYENLRIWGDNHLSLAKTYAANGCLSGSVDYDCISQNHSANYDELMSSASVSYNYIHAILTNAKDDLVAQLELLQNNLFTGEDDE